MTTNDEILAVIAMAQQVVGHNPSGNRQLNPDRHAPCLKDKPEAGPLFRILTENTNVVNTIKEYLEKDPEANRMQARYKRYRNVILAVLTGAILLGAGRLIFAWSDWVRILPHIVATLFVYLALTVPLVLAWLLKREKCAEHWQRSRAMAEALRVRLFEEVFDSKAERRNGELPPLLLKMEYFRRYQFELQKAYHKGRRAEHSLSSRIADVLRVVLSGVVVIWILALLVHIAAALEDNYAWYWAFSWVGDLVSRYHSIGATYYLDNAALLIAVVVGSLYGLTFLYTQFDKSQRNAARHAVALSNFEYLCKELEDARINAAHEDELAVRRFVRRVHSIMSSENADWVRLADLDRGILEPDQQEQEQLTAAQLV